ncbi:uncharacterized protein N7459_004466 [Penicillium hispanicum]|uniref:uncharacterized protein n=1 Tax=Penicillium hispanicum TaxID=1080232 RepID=UPI00253FD52B|nr:uncharacterized protein N7459_004466 [Penicillium hispanicum]KAJ5584666.1 hypothetical protein N7459_004466 [Penicillium hispanicum]
MAGSSSSNPPAQREMPELPGFIFDQEKGKYFKIQANHVAPPGSGHSQDSVKRKRDEKEERENRLKTKQKVSRETVHKHSSLKQPWTGLSREIGARPRPRAEEETVIFSHFLTRKKLYKFHGFPRISLSQIARHPSSGILIGGGSHVDACYVSLCYPNFQSGSWKYYSPWEQALIRDQYRLSSFSMGRGNLLLSTMDSGPLGDSLLQIHRFPGPDEMPEREWPTNLRSLQRVNTMRTLWCSAASSDPIPKFAVGTSDGLYMLENHHGVDWELHRCEHPSIVSRRSGRSDVTAVGFYQDTLVAAGMRNSAILLHDMRSKDSAMVLQHTERVDKVCHIHGYLLMAAGPTSAQIYDVRATPKIVQKRPQPMTPFHQSSRPFLTFPGCVPGVNGVIDVSPENRLLACATRDNTVQLFSLRTGQQIASPLTEYRYSQPVTCLRFENHAPEDVPNGPQSPGLLVGATSVVDHWAWH